VWSELKGRVTATTNVSSLTKLQKADVFLARASELNEFYTNNPTHVSFPEARRLEAVCLSFAAMNGNTSEDSRRMILAEAVRRDTRLSSENRFEVIAWGMQIDIARQSLRTTPAHLAAQEMATRALIAEFPTVSDGYESLLALGRDSPASRGAVILRDLQAMDAPPAVAAEAKSWSNRLSLAGTSLRIVLEEVGLGALAVSMQGKPVVLYTWTVADQTSQQLAKRMAGSTPGVALFGINLDSPSVGAASVSLGETLPGRQYYAKGSNDGLVKRLILSRSRLCYLADKSGVIRDVNASAWFREKVSGLNN
jgi:hypothetical protein